MKVLLWQDIDKLGKRGEVVEVRDGYARNCLLPRKMASLPTPSLRQELELAKRRLDKQEAALRRLVVLRRLLGCYHHAATSTLGFGFLFFLAATGFRPSHKDTVSLPSPGAGLSSRNCSTFSPAPSSAQAS